MTRALLIVVLVGLFSGCQAPLPEINYRGSLDGSVADVVAAGEAFVSAFSQESGFRVDSRMPSSGASKEVDRVDYHLRTDSTKRVWIYVTAYKKERMIAVTIGGDFSSAAAIDAAKVSEKIFARLFPGSTYSPFQRYQGLLGP
ncbi:MAG: hypothetical protein KIT44_04020 [Opitutaceae bacterium]|nr:hypothetical protein [Opitutaceae bacterium]